MPVLLGETAQTDPLLSERLGNLRYRAHETPIAFLGRAASLAANYAETPLTEEDLAYASDLLPDWQFDSKTIHDDEYATALRRGPVAPVQRERLAGYYVPERRLISAGSSAILLLAKEALTGSDLACIFEVEKIGAEARQPEPAKVSPPLKARSKPAQAKSSTSQSVETASEAPKLILSKRQKEVIELRALHSGEIAYKLDIIPPTVNERLAKAQKENDIDLEELLTRALNEQLIDLSLLPKPNNYNLTKREKKVLTEHGFASHADTAKALKTTPRVVSHIWNDLYIKLGASYSTRTHAFLIAKRDGVF